MVHSTKNVVLKRCNFLDSTLVLISGARVQVKDTLFTQDDSSTYECSIVASGENTVLSMHGGKISGGVVGVTAYGGATASLTGVAFEHISVSGVEAKGSDTRADFTRCSFHSFSAGCQAPMHAVHALNGSFMFLDTVNMQGAHHIDYGLLVHTRASDRMHKCTVDYMTRCGAEILGGGTADVVGCGFSHTDRAIHVAGVDSYCDARRCSIHHCKTGVLASRMGQVLLQQCNVKDSECGYSMTNGATMHSTECTSEENEMGWRADKSGTRLMAQGSVGTDARGPHVVHVAGGAKADFDSYTFRRSSREVVLITSQRTSANLVGCTVSEGGGSCVLVHREAQAFVKWCMLSDSTEWHGLDAHDAGTRVQVIDCLSGDNAVWGFAAHCNAQCVVTGCRTVANGERGYGSWHGGRMTVTDCSSQGEDDGHCGRLVE